MEDQDLMSDVTLVQSAAIEHLKRKVGDLEGFCQYEDEVIAKWKELKGGRK